MAFSFDPVKSPPFYPTPLTKDVPSRRSPYSGGGQSRPSLSSPSSFSRQRHFDTNSVSLACLSPDSRSLHSLLSNGTVVTQFLPLHNSVDNRESRSHAMAELPFRKSQPSNSTEHSMSTGVLSVTTNLPPYIVESFQIDPPIEMVCIDNDTPSKVSRKNNNMILYALPLLCIYSEKSAFVIQIQYEGSCEDDVEGQVELSREWDDSAASQGRGIQNRHRHVKGTVLEPVHEPFESFLTTTSCLIQRIRPAPHSHLYNGNTYQTLCNKGAMIMLASGGDTDDTSAIVLFHGYDPIYEKDVLRSWSGMTSSPANVTVPAKLHCEQTDMTPVVDFCFLPSSPLNEHSLWNAMTIVLSTLNGSLFALSPIVFHNTVFPQHIVQDGSQTLEKMIVKYEHLVSKGAECRRAKAALQFLKDVFGDLQSDPRASKDAYAKVNVVHPTKRMSAVVWPVGVQTLFMSQEREELDTVQCMDIIPPSSVVSSAMNNGTSVLVLAKTSTIDYILIPSGINILPRFAFEARDDRQYLDNLVVDAVVMMERFCMKQRGSDSENIHENSKYGKRVVLIPDPLERSMLHRVSKEGVTTIVTNLLDLMEKKLSAIMFQSDDLHDESIPDETDSNAWPSIVMVKNQQKKLIGIVVSNDAQFGHVLVAVLDDGTTESINMTAVLYLNEAKKEAAYTTSNGSVMANSIKDANVALKELETIKPLYQEIKPFFDQITLGLSNMTKIVGGSTYPKDITPGALAIFLTTKQVSEQNVIMPMKEMNSIIESRQKYLKSMRESQSEQISRLREMMEILKTRLQSNMERKKVLESNAQLLSQRSSAVLSTVRDLSPRITDAERLYFADIKRYKTKCDKYESSVRELRSQLNILYDNARQGHDEIHLNKDQVTSCMNLLDGQNDLLQRIKNVVAGVQEKVERLIVESGLEDKAQQ